MAFSRRKLRLSTRNCQVKFRIMNIIVLRVTINLFVKTVDTKDGRGGGVLLLIKNSINYVQIVPDNSIDYTNSVWIEVVNNDGKKTVYSNSIFSRHPYSHGIPLFQYK